MHVWGICGGSGSGKSYLTTQLIERFGDDCAVISFDSYYHDLRQMTFEQRCKVNFDHPDSLDGDLMAAHLQALKQGRSVDIPVYDFSQHLRTGETETVNPCRVIVVEGILLMAFPGIAAQLTLSVYLDVPASVRLERRVERDVAERGRDEQTVRQNFADVVGPMHDRFVAPNGANADIVVNYGDDRDALLAILFERAALDVAPREAR